MCSACHLLAGEDPDYGRTVGQLQAVLASLTPVEEFDPEVRSDARLHQLSNALERITEARQLDQLSTLVQLLELALKHRERDILREQEQLNDARQMLDQLLDPGQDFHAMVTRLTPEEA